MPDFILDDTDVNKVVYSPICTFCKHLIDIDKKKCKAFDRIPDEIWNGKNDHKKPFKGDNGITYEADNG